MGNGCSHGHESKTSIFKLQFLNDPQDVPRDTVEIEFYHVLAARVVHRFASFVLRVDDARDKFLAEAALVCGADRQRRNERTIGHDGLKDTMEGM